MSYMVASPLESQEILEQALKQVEEEDQAQAIRDGQREQAMAQVAQALSVLPEDLTDMQREFVEAFCQRRAQPRDNFKVDFGVETRKPEVK
jgi:hypothetical protein